MSPAPNDPFVDWLPQWQFEERHERFATASPAAVLAAAAAYRPEHDRLVAGFIAMREWPARAAAGLGLQSALSGRSSFGFDDFTLIGQTVDTLVYGLIGRFWERDYGLRPIRDGEGFRQFAEPGTARLLLGFHAAAESDGTRLSTVTRIHCPDAQAMARMRPYWLLIRPVSGWIRHRMLARIAEAASAATAA
ncbi:hypothetical protein AACH06_29435 [Ideonella sp. DXS29W]|uniref:DUF2867 domain-containing protein n=1 Tax=Ideonella lacteola TaxID=2984193 RepID=A0ABU9BYA5_9BURK